MFVCRSLLSFAGGRMKGCSKDPNLLLVNEMLFVKRFISFFLLSMFWHCKDLNVVRNVTIIFRYRLNIDLVLLVNSSVQVREGDYQEEDAQ